MLLIKKPIRCNKQQNFLIKIQYTIENLCGGNFAKFEGGLISRKHFRKVRDILLLSTKKRSISFPALFFISLNIKLLANGVIFLIFTTSIPVRWIF